MVNLFKGGEPVKMSKRTGELIELAEVIDEIGADATRYFLIEKKPDLHLDFDLDLAKKTSNENPVYYIQYAHARICTIIEKTNNLNTNNQTKNLTNEERQLILQISRINDIIIDAADTLEPYKIANYTYDLAKAFHSFYQTSPVIDNNTVIQHRYDTIQSTKEALVICSNILGISTPEKM